MDGGGEDADRVDVLGVDISPSSSTTIGCLQFSATFLASMASQRRGTPQHAGSRCLLKKATRASRPPSNHLLGSLAEDDAGDRPVLQQRPQ
jgi:hypothetical protein